MKLVYTHPNPLIVNNARNLLDAANLQTQLKNEHASGAVGELSAIDTWPELWINEDNDYSQAMHILQPLMSQEQQPQWLCQQCGEHNEESFEVCWQCQTAKP